MRSSEDEHRTLRDEFEFLDLKRQLGFFLGLFTTGDLFAQFARMRAVKSLRDSVGNRLGLETVGEHVCPRHSLKYGPMPTRRAEQREDQQTMTDSFHKP